MPIAEQPGDQQQHTDERKHEADWPANIESHKFVPFVLPEYDVENNARDQKHGADHRRLQIPGLLLILESGRE